MNAIGQSLPQNQTAPTAPGAAEAASTQAPEGDGSFDSLLQQRSVEAGEVIDPTAASDSEAELTNSDNSSDPADALISAGLIALFGLPIVAPLPAPVQTPPLEDSVSEFQIAVGPKETQVAPSEASSPGFSQPADVTSIAPYSTTPETTTRPTIREPASVPQPKDAPQREVPPLPEPAPAVLNVATVRGIPPTEQTSPALPAEANLEIAPADAAAISSEVIDRIDPAIPATTSAPTAENITGKAERPIAAENKTPAPEPAPARANAPSVQTPAGITAIPKAEFFGGIAAAKPGRAMSAPTLQRSQNPTATTSLEVSANGTASVPAAIGDLPSLRSAPVPAQENPRERSMDENPANPENSSAPISDFPQATITNEAMSAKLVTTPGARIQQADVAQVVNHTLAAAERLRTSGQERVDVALKLEGGQELTIQLRIANGQVTPTIRTESEPLRIALEQNWAQFSQRSGERELQITKPIFESPQTSSNMTDLNQQREGRQRAYQEPASTFAQQYSDKRKVAPGINQASPPQTGVRLYA